jgi:hypothetical protein
MRCCSAEEHGSLGSMRERTSAEPAPLTPVEVRTHLHQVLADSVELQGSSIMWKDIIVVHVLAIEF